MRSKMRQSALRTLVSPFESILGQHGRHSISRPLHIAMLLRPLSTTCISSSRPSIICEPSVLAFCRQRQVTIQSIRQPVAYQVRSFSQTIRCRRDHHFDTLKFVQTLKEEGFTEEQAVSMMKILSNVIEESILNLTRTMVLREDQEKATYTQKVDFAKLRSELVAADASESALTRSSHDRVANEIAKLNTRLRDEVQRTLASVRLDLNLEKGRIREESNAQDMKIKETETRIDQEVAALKERLETVKFQTLQWLFGVCTGTAALILATWRLLM